MARLWLDEDEYAAPAIPDRRQRHPEQPVATFEMRPRMSAFEHSELLSQCKNRQAEIAAGTKKTEDVSQQGRGELGHGKDNRDRNLKKKRSAADGLRFAELFQNQAIVAFRKAEALLAQGLQLFTNAGDPSAQIGFGINDRCASHQQPPVPRIIDRSLVIQEEPLCLALLRQRGRLGLTDVEARGLANLFEPLCPAGLRSDAVDWPGLSSARI